MEWSGAPGKTPDRTAEGLRIQFCRVFRHDRSLRFEPAAELSKEKT